MSRSTHDQAESKEAMFESEKDIKGANETQDDVLSLGAGSITSLDDEGRRSSIGGGIANLTNTIIGTGILSLPHGFAECGWAISIILMLFSLGMSLLSIHMLAKCCHRLGGTNTSYGSISSAIKPWLGVVSDIMVVLNCIGACISYLIIAGDLLPQFMQQVVHIEPGTSSVLLNRQLWISICFALFGVPLTCMPNVDKLKFTSALAIVAVFYVMVLVLLYCIEPVAYFDPCEGKDPLTCKGHVLPVAESGIGFLRALPMFIFAFCCQYNVPGIYNVLKKPSVKRIDMVGTGSLSLVTAIYFMFGFCGLLTYGDRVSSNILTDYPIKIDVSVARVMLAFVVSVSYPLLMHPVRQALINLSLKAITLFNSNAEVGQGSKGYRIVYWTCTVVSLAATYSTAMVVTDLGLVFGIIGSTASTMIVGLPGVFYLYMFVYNSEARDAEMGWGPVSVSKWDGLLKASAWGLVVFSIVFMPLGVYAMFA